MVITKSSVESLQAKKGLPRGNQIVGWLVLGMMFTNENSYKTSTYQIDSDIFDDATVSSFTTKQSLSSSTDNHIFDVLSYFRDPHYFL